MKTVIFGGTFNPPHLGHENTVRIVNEALSPDRFLIIPTYIPPHKQMAAGSPSPLQRLELCHLAFDKFDFAEVSDIELRRQGPSYTVDTLTEMKKLYPEDDFYLVIGSDSLLNFRLWVRYREILGMCTLAVVSREENDLAHLKEAADGLRTGCGAGIILIGNRPLVLSSSEIRRNNANEATLSPAVLNYIKEKGLY